MHLLTGSNAWVDYEVITRMSKVWELNWIATDTRIPG